MKAKLVNMSRWRSDDIIALYHAALQQVHTPNEPEFLVFTDMYNGPCVEADREREHAIIARFACEKVGTGSKREASPLKVVATSRSLDDGSFGQLAKYLIRLLSWPVESSLCARPSRSVPRWSHELAFLEREPAAEPLKIVKLMRARSWDLGLRDFQHPSERYITTEDIPNILRFTRTTAASRYKGNLDHALNECRQARTRLRKARTDDRRINRYLDRMERVVDQNNVR